MSGQGPYFGQKVWFEKYHQEKLPSAVERYANEIKRVIGVVDAHLDKQGTDYLVGDRITYADLMFLPWNNGVAQGMNGPEFAKEWEEKYPKCWAWHQRLMERPAIKATFEEKAKATGAGH